MKIIRQLPFCFFVLLTLTGGISAHAQMIDLGFGLSPSLYSGTELGTYDNGVNPYAPYSIEVENTPVIILHVELGMYFHLVQMGPEASMGAHYEAIPFFGSMDGGQFDVTTRGIDLPVMAEMRFGNAATTLSTSYWGGSIAAGAMFTRAHFSMDQPVGEDDDFALNTFMPAFSASLGRDHVGVQLMVHPGKFQILQDAYDPGALRAEYFRYHLTLFWHLGEL